MAEALAVAHHHWVEHLLGIILSNGTGNDAALGILAVKLDMHIALGLLLAVGQQALGDHHLAALLTVKTGVALGGVDAANLDGVHLHGGVFPQVNDGLGVHYIAAGLAGGVLAVVLFRIVDPAVFADVEGVHTVVAALITAGIVNAAAGDDLYIAIIAHIKIVIHQLGKPSLADDDGDVALLALGAGLDTDVNALLAIGLGSDLDVLGGLAGLTAAVFADIKGAYGLAGEIGDLFQQLGVNVGNHSLTSFFSSTGQPPRVSARIRGKTSSVVPRWAMVPPETTIISSASWMIRSWWEMIIMVE